MSSWRPAFRLRAREGATRVYGGSAVAFGKAGRRTLQDVTKKTY